MKLNFKGSSEGCWWLLLQEMIELYPLQLLECKVVKTKSRCLNDDFFLRSINSDPFDDFGFDDFRRKKNEKSSKKHKVVICADTLLSDTNSGFYSIRNPTDTHCCPSRTNPAFLLVGWCHTGLAKTPICQQQGSEERGGQRAAGKIKSEASKKKVRAAVARVVPYLSLSF